jgi:hypothetical protein
VIPSPAKGLLGVVLLLAFGFVQMWATPRIAPHVARWSRLELTFETRWESREDPATAQREARREAAALAGLEFEAAAFVENVAPKTDIEVRVVDSEGRPIANATVLATHPEERAPDHWLESARACFPRASTLRTQTDAEGRTRVESAIGRPRAIGVMADGFIATTRTDRIAGDVVTIVLARGQRRDGIVVDEADRPIEGARVRLRGIDDAPWTATDAAGRFTLWGTGHEEIVECMARGFDARVAWIAGGETHAAPTSVRMLWSSGGFGERPSVIASLDAPRAGARELRIRVVARETGQGVSGARVLARDDSRGGPWPSASFLDTTQADGFVRVQVPQVCDALVVTAPDRIGVEVPLPRAPIDGVLRVALELGSRVRGVCVDGEGRLVPGARVAWRDDASNGAPEGQRANLTQGEIDADGRGEFEFTVADPDAIEMRGASGSVVGDWLPVFGGDARETLPVVARSAEFVRCVDAITREPLRWVLARGSRRDAERAIEQRAEPPQRPLATNGLTDEPMNGDPRWSDTKSLPSAREAMFFVSPGYAVAELPQHAGAGSGRRVVELALTRDASGTPPGPVRPDLRVACEGVPLEEISLAIWFPRSGSFDFEVPLARGGEANVPLAWREPAQIQAIRTTWGPTGPITRQWLTCTPRLVTVDPASTEPIVLQVAPASSGSWSGELVMDDDIAGSTSDWVVRFEPGRGTTRAVGLLPDPAPDDVLDGSFAAEWVACVGPDRRFRFEGIPTGDYDVEVFARWRGPRDGSTYATMRARTGFSRHSGTGNMRLNADESFTKDIHLDWDR